MGMGEIAQPTFAAAVKARRLELGYSARVCARLAGVDVDNWRAVEHGQNPTLATMLRMAHALETTVSALLDGVTRDALGEDSATALSMAEMAERAEKRGSPASRAQD